MSSPPNIEPLAHAMLAVQRLLEVFGNRGLVIGGVAVSLVATPRFTADVDALLLCDLDDVPHLLEQANKNGLVSRVADPVAFAGQTRVLPLRHEGSGVQVDVSLGLLPFEEEAIQRAHLYRFGQFAIPLPTPEDLIIFKAVAHRPKDLADIRAIADTHPGLDRQRVERWVRDFANTLDMPELWEDLAPLLPTERNP